MALRLSMNSPYCSARPLTEAVSRPPGLASGQPSSCPPLPDLARPGPTIVPGLMPAGSCPLLARLAATMLDWSSSCCLGLSWRSAR
jgi:hypothetical protein